MTMVFTEENRVAVTFLLQNEGCYGCSSSCCCCVQKRRTLRRTLLQYQRDCQSLDAPPPPLGVATNTPAVAMITRAGASGDHGGGHGGGHGGAHSGDHGGGHSGGHGGGHGGGQGGVQATALASGRQQVPAAAGAVSMQRAGDAKV